MTNQCTFLVVFADGASRWVDSYCIDRNDAIAQIAETFYGDFDIVLFRFV